MKNNIKDKFHIANFFLLMFLVCGIIKLLSVAYNLEKPVVIQQESIQLMEKCSSIDTGNCLEFYTHPVDSSVSICIIKTQETCTN